jgi:hypothetical protein
MLVGTATKPRMGEAQRMRKAEIDACFIHQNRFNQGYLLHLALFILVMVLSYTYVPQVVN